MCVDTSIKVYSLGGSDFEDLIELKMVFIKTSEDFLVDLYFSLIEPVSI